MIQPLAEAEQGNSPKEIYGWLMNRGITPETADTYGVVQDIRHFNGEPHIAVGFPYKVNGVTSAVKWRSTKTKAFTQSGAAQTFWLLDDIEKGDVLYITEGEADTLACRQAGIKAISIPNGAPAQLLRNGNLDPREDKKFAYIWHAKEIVDAAPRIVLAVDNDAPGDALAEEIARRAGKAKCYRVQWPDGCKDANDVLRLHGPVTVRECIEAAAPFPVKGLYDTSEFLDKVIKLYDRGLPSGESTGYPDVDEIYTVAPGQLTIVTGSPGSGKSAFIDNIMVNLAIANDWKFAVCSFENPPEIHIAKLAAIYAGKPFFSGPTPRLTERERQAALGWVAEHFFFLHQADGSLSNLGEIIDLARAAVMRYGIRGLVIDPMNYIARDQDRSETDWVSDGLTALKVFAAASDLHCWLCAHPSKQQRRQDGTYPVPTGYDISGSAHYFNKADMGITLHRPDKTSLAAELHVWKSRFFWVGKVGQCDLKYDIVTGRYIGPQQMPQAIYSCA